MNPARRRVDQAPNTIVAPTSCPELRERAIFQQISASAFSGMANALPKESGWGDAGDNLSTVAAIDSEVGIGCKDDGVGKCFRHTHEASIGEAYRHVGIFPQQPQHGFHIIAERDRKSVV